MPKVYFVKKARKDYPNNGILKGDSYYHWTFRFGGTHRSKVRPKPSQLTQSEFLSEVYSIQEELEEITTEWDIEDIRSTIEEKAERLRELGEEQQEKHDNMPENLEYSPVAELLGERAENCEQMADDLESIDMEIDIERDDYETYKEYETAMLDRIQEIIDEITGISYEGS